MSFDDDDGVFLEIAKKLGMILGGRIYRCLRVCLPAGLLLAVDLDFACDGGDGDVAFLKEGKSLTGSLGNWSCRCCYSLRAVSILVLVCGLGDGVALLRRCLRTYSILVLDIG